MDEEKKSINDTEEKNENTEYIELPEVEADTSVYEDTVKKLEEDEKNKPPRYLGAFEWLETFALAMSVMVILFIFIFKYVTVDGTSMLNTLENGQKLIISSVSDYDNGDVIVVYEPHLRKALVKRIIAKGGQTVSIDGSDWTVYVDGTALDEPYVRHEEGRAMKTYGFEGTVTVPEGCIFVMGDNRNGSTDSRSFGCIDVRNVLGKVIFRITPLSKMGTVK